ncbi:ABC transporter ATP-binding protein [Plantactinospora siamensis]|uniref:ABC transporter ATP-binding protein n=1 Tax=Plantactinospora siamensis TaxID=555372 RepID=A0ABV6P298_9ACTN
MTEVRFVGGSRPETASDAGGPGMLRAAGAAARLVWRTVPGGVLGYAGCALSAGAAPVAIAWVTKLVLDDLTAGAALSTLLGLAAVLAGTSIAIAALTQFEQYLRGEIGRTVSLAAADDLYRAVERLRGLKRLEDPVFLDRLRLAQQATIGPAELVDGVLSTARGLVTGLGLVVSLTVISPMMTAVVLVTGIPMLITELRLSRQRAAMTWSIGPTERREIFYRGLLESTEAAKEIRLFGIGPFVRGRMLAERRTADAQKRRVDRREAVAQGGLALVSTAVAGAGLAWAVAAAHQKVLTIGDVSMFIAAVAGVQAAIATLLTAITQTHQQLLLFGHFAAVLEVEPDLPAPPDPVALPPLRRGIELRDVWFRYSDQHPWVLRGVNLVIPHGRALALVGLNGAGKSTLVKLLCRFYDPTRGTILWDGIDLRDADVSTLRQRTAAVFQDYVEYDLTAGENIAIGDIGRLADREALRAAARRAGVHEVVERLPRGYDTLLTRMLFDENDDGDPSVGVRLSGGQWQRLALARAFMRDRRDLMILDEPSAGLDAEAEHEVHSQLREHRIGVTTLLISHRLGSVRDADTIAVLRGGVVVEQGPHRELIAAAGVYARLFRLQSTGYQAEAAEEPEVGSGPELVRSPEASGAAGFVATDSR